MAASGSLVYVINRAIPEVMIIAAVNALVTGGTLVTTVLSFCELIWLAIELQAGARQPHGAKCGNCVCQRTRDYSVDFLGGRVVMDGKGTAMHPEFQFRAVAFPLSLFWLLFPDLFIRLTLITSKPSIYKLS